MLRYLTSLLVVFFCLFSNKSAANNVIENIRLSEQGEMARLVIEFSSPFKFTYFSLKKPERLVIDLSDTSSTTDLSQFSILSSCQSDIEGSHWP